ncbi:MAG: hypothetical protein KAG28_01320 [Cocleimonas sp.]|nr:hypothetical protein [Cocleimonas sp.]
MNALKAAVWVSKLEDRRDALRLRLHTMGLKSLLNKNDPENVKPERLSLQNFPAYSKEKALSGALYLASIPAILGALFRPKSLLGVLLLMGSFILIIAFVMIALISGSMYYYLSGPVDKSVLQSYLKQHQQGIALTVHDQNNDLLGALPPLTSEYDNARGALYVKKTPPLYWDLVKSSTDESLSFDYQKMSFWSLYKNILQFKNASYKGINLAAPYQQNPYNDNLIQRIGASLHQITTGEDKRSLLSRFLQLKETLHIARHLFPYLSKNKGEEFKRWIAMHAPLLSAKDDVYGLASIAMSLFGKEVSDLNQGQQALLAIAYHQQIDLAALFSDDAKKRQDQWQYVVKQTVVAVTKQYKNKKPQALRNILADLDEIKLAPSFELSSQWLNFLNSKQTDQHYQHLLQRSELTLGKLKEGLYRTLRQTAITLPKHDVLTDVKISLPLLQNQKFDQTLGKVFKTVQRFYPKSFDKKLGRSIENDGAVIDIRVSNEQGSLIRSYQRGTAGERPIANLSDIMISSLLLSRGDQPKTRYCNKSHGGARNASEPIRDGVKNCKALGLKGHAFSLKQSVQQGKPLALLYALTQTHPILSDDFIKLYTNFGLSQTSSSTPATTKVLAYELSLGLNQATPKTIHQVIHSMTELLYGVPYGNTPSLIDTVQTIHLSTKKESSFVQEDSKDASNTLGIYFSAQSSLNDMRSLFSIPNNKKRNPLKFLRSVEKKYGITFLFVKSATSKIPNGRTRDKWLVGSLRLRQHIYSFTIMIGSDDLNGGLGKNISHQQLMLPVINALVESLE